MPFPGASSSSSVVAQAVDVETIALLFYAVVFFGPPLLFLYGGLPRIWTGIRLLATDLDAVGDASEGERIELEGTARSAGTVVESSDDERLLSESDERGFEGVPFLLDCADGTVLVRGDRLSGLRKSSTSSRTYLDADETAYVTGFARDPSSVTDVAVPDVVDAVVGPPETTGFVDRIRTVPSLPFTVVNGPRSNFQSYRLTQGIGVTGLAVAWVVLFFLFVATSGADPGICTRYHFC